MALTPLPPAPSILDPENFSEEADAFVAALATLVTELNAIIGLTIPAGSAAASTLTGNTLAANVLASSLTSFGANAFATQSQQEAASSTAVAVPPGRQQFHPSAAKGWCVANFAGGNANSFNVAGITDGGSGLLTVTWATDFSSASYAVHVSVESALPWIATVDTGTRLAGSTVFRCQDSAGVEGDADAWHVVAYGDQ